MFTKCVSKTVTALFLCFLLSQSLAACNLPKRSSAKDPSAVSTAAAQTARAKTATSTPSTSVAPTITISSPTLAPTLTPTLGVLPPTAIPSPVLGGPTITAKENTNCRLGPSIDYPRVGFLLPGETSTIVGRNADSSWWYIDNPQKPGDYCWMWGGSTTVQGDVASLPLITPPPPPTASAEASFDVAFLDVHNCSGVPAAIFQVANTGSVEFQSLVLTIKNLDNDATLYGPELTNLPFMNSPSGCPPGHNVLPPGETKYIGGEVGFLVIPGDEGRAIIALCERPDSTGECVEMVVEFIFP